MNKDESLTWHKRLGGDEIIEKNTLFKFIFLLSILTV